MSLYFNTRTFFNNPEERALGETHLILTMQLIQSSLLSLRLHDDISVVIT